MPSLVAEEIRSAYRTLGSPVVAVRSSATAEDMAGASMAGQYETFLNVQGEQALLDAIRRCWASLDAPRVQAYLHEHGIDASRVAMAVIVQRQVSADASRRALHRQSARRPQSRDAPRSQLGTGGNGGLRPGAAGRAAAGEGHRPRAGGGHCRQAGVSCRRREGRMPVEESRRRQPCLRGRDVYRLWQLATARRRAFRLPPGHRMGHPWRRAVSASVASRSRPWPRPPPTRRYCTQRKRHLRQEAAAGRGPWVLHNLAETLPHPTPLTWSIMKRFMSGSGGFGAMYRQAGFEPSPVVEREGFLECIAGRIYMDATRAPEMLFRGLPVCLRSGRAQAQSRCLAIAADAALRIASVAMEGGAKAGGRSGQAGCLVRRPRT